MENNKYYTPIIDEFHVGFEFETKDGFQDGTVKTQQDYDKSEWIKKIFKVGDSPYIERVLNGKNADNGLCGIRVKLLDREDIESLGWEPNTIIENYFKFNKHNIWFSDNNPIIKISVSGDYDFEETGFQGTIKNKSEFQKLMTQLDIK